MVLMALSLLAQVACFSTGVGLRESCWGHVRSSVCRYCCFAGICVGFFLDILSVSRGISETAE